MHTFEVFVDIKECTEKNDDRDRIMATRYEINASGRTDAHDTALFQAGKDYPKATEYDIRITRVLK
ncbi:MAG: hypothetical protein KTR27_10060 [Leptolyngbyaceae cyanobacterium MAG.088]|nr:hypothetical protein [Leptolyngbyaceae cyanobacterium MAG.088]